MAIMDFPSSPVEGQTFNSGATTWVFTGGVWVINNSQPPGTPPWPLLFQTIAERNLYFSIAPPNGTRCYIRQCEWMYRAGVGWEAIPFMQGMTTVRTADANAMVEWIFPIPYQSVKTAHAQPSSHPNNPISTMVDPAGYNSNLSMRWVTPGFANGTWRWEIAAWGYLDGFT